MTRKHFQIIANTINSLVLDGTLDPWNAARTATAFADDLGSTNPRFNREKFIEASLRSLDGITVRHSEESNLNLGGLI